MKLLSYDTDKEEPLLMSQQIPPRKKKIVQYELPEDVYEIILNRARKVAESEDVIPNFYTARLMICDRDVMVILRWDEEKCATCGYVIEDGYDQWHLCGAVTHIGECSEKHQESCTWTDQVDEENDDDWEVHIDP
jgi:hypothetical protein